MSDHAALLIKYSNEGSFVPYEPSLLLGAVLVQADPHEGHLRAKIKRNTPAEIVKHFPLGDTITQLASDPSSEQIWVAFKSGKIVVISYEFNHATLQLNLHKQSSTLYGHRSEVTTLELCSDFGYLLSGSTDHTCLLWDKEDSHLIRALELSGSVQVTATSKTSGDFAVACSRSTSTSSSSSAIIVESEASPNSCELSLYTINGVLVASEAVEPPITALGFSSCPEGVSVNALASGHRNGNVRLWSSWDLSPLADIPTAQTSPITALAYNLCNQNLFVATQEREVIIYEKSHPNSNHPKAAYVHLTSLY